LERWKISETFTYTSGPFQPLIRLSSRLPTAFGRSSTQAWRSRATTLAFSKSHAALGEKRLRIELPAVGDYWRTRRHDYGLALSLVAGTCLAMAARAAPPEMRIAGLMSAMLVLDSSRKISRLLTGFGTDSR
jgi:hypothetical protein